MSFRFFRRVQLLPGLNLNLSKSGASVSVGRRGARFTTGTHGRRVTLGLPGTGLFYTRKLGAQRRRRARSARPAAQAASTPQPAPQPARRKHPHLDNFSLGFMGALFASPEKRQFSHAMRLMLRGHDKQAAEQMDRLFLHADACWMSGILYFCLQDWATAETSLRAALGSSDQLGELFGQFDFNPSQTLQFSEAYQAEVGLDSRGVRLLLAETLQIQDKLDEARDLLEELLAENPQDEAIRTALAELLLDVAEAQPSLDSPQRQQALQRVVELTGEASQYTYTGCCQLLYRARAQRLLHQPALAWYSLRDALLLRTNLSRDLQAALFYEKGLTHLDEHEREKATACFQEVYKLDPNHQQVAQILGFKPE